VVKIRLARFGSKKNPHYRIVVADARNRRDGRNIESIGRYNPRTEPSTIVVNEERAKYWLSVGAQPTDPVKKLLKIQGITRS
jgi:small subunit ribosomal protein S16